MYCQYCHAPLDPDLNELYSGFCSAAHRELHTEVLKRRESLSLESSRPGLAGANKTEDFSDGCPVCGTTIPLLAKLRGARFCSSEHEERYQKRGEAQILERLNWHALGGAGSGAMLSGRKPKLRRPPARPPAVEPPAPTIPMPERPAQWTGSALMPPELAPAIHRPIPDAGIGFTQRISSPPPPPSSHRQCAAPLLPSIEQPKWTETSAALTTPPARPLVESCAPRPRQQMPARSAAMPAPQIKRDCEWVQRSEAQPARLLGPGYELQPVLPSRRLSHKAPQPHRHQAGFHGAGDAAMSQAWALAPAIAPALAPPPPPRLGVNVLPLHADANWHPVRPAPGSPSDGNRQVAAAEWFQSDAVVSQFGLTELPADGPAFEIPPRVVRGSVCAWNPVGCTPVSRQTDWMVDARPAALAGAPGQPAAVVWPQQPPSRGVAFSHFAQPVQDAPAHLPQPAWRLGAANLVPPAPPSSALEGAPSTLTPKREFRQCVPRVSTLPIAAPPTSQWSSVSGTETAPEYGHPLVRTPLAPHPPHHGPEPLRPAALLSSGIAKSAPQAWRAGTAASLIDAGLIARPESKAAGHLKQHSACTIPYRPGALIPARPVPNWSATLQTAPTVQFSPLHPDSTEPQHPPRQTSTLSACKLRCLESRLNWTLPAPEWPAGGAAMPTAGPPGTPALAAYTLERRTAPAAARPSPSPSLPRAKATDPAVRAFATPAIGNQIISVPSAVPPSWTAMLPSSRTSATGPVAPRPLAAARITPAWIDVPFGGVLQTLPLAPASLPRVVGPARRETTASLQSTRLPAPATHPSAYYLAPQRPCHPPSVVPATAFTQGTFRKYPAEAGSAFRPLAMETVEPPRPLLLLASDTDPASAIFTAPCVAPTTRVLGLAHRPPASLGRLVASGKWSRKPSYPVRLRTPSMQILFGPAPKHPNELKRAPE